jgi:hypothetical protein
MKFQIHTSQNESVCGKNRSLSALDLSPPPASMMDLLTDKRIRMKQSKI